MIYTGNNTIQGIKLGANEISAIYCGNLQIYPFSARTNYVSMTASAAQTVTAPAGKSFQYSYNKETWRTMTSAVEFGTSDKETIYITGKNASGINGAFSFGNTTSIVSVSGNCMALLDWENPPTTVPASGFTYLFSGQTALHSVSSDFLPATTLADYCYSSMFQGCTSLTTAPSLPTTTLTQYCYEGMFQGCTSLTTAPSLPATTLANGCYQGMFQGCTSLTKAPNLPAETLSAECYKEMFSECTSLNEIHCSATTNVTSANTLNWVYGVASAGTFYGNMSAPWEKNSDNGIPKKWFYYQPTNNYIVMEASAAQTVTAPAGKTMEYSYNGDDWCVMSDATAFGTGSTSIIYIRGKNTGGINGAFIFGNTTSIVDVRGNCMALLDWENVPSAVPTSGFTNLFNGQIALRSVSSGFLPATTLNNCSYFNMFAGCTSLEIAPDLPALTAPASCYGHMFEECTSLMTAPSMSATSIGEYCCTGMFYNCKNIERTPVINATTLEKWSCAYMFYGCSQLNNIYCFATKKTAESCVLNWVSGVASTGDFYGKSAAGWATGVSGIPSGWTRHLS